MTLQSILLGQDQLLLGWLRSSLTETLVAQVVSSTTTKELWTSIEDYYSSTSRARLHELKRQIQTASKGESSCFEYLLRLRRVVDELAFIGSPLPDDDLVTAMINGLGTIYKSLVAVLFTVRCHGSFTFSNLYGLLLSHEALLKSQEASGVSSTSAFYTGHGGGNNRSRSNSHTRFVSPQTPFPPGQNYNSPNFHSARLTYSSNQSSGQISQTSPAQTDGAITKVQCQICTKYGHSAKIYYKRYSADQDWKPNPQFNAYNTQILPSNQESTNWILDSGATNHITNDLN
jgi:gag-polypeptide of LTR copia-type